MLDNPYENFDKGSFSSSMKAFIDDLDKKKFDSTFKDPLDSETVCITGTSYVPVFIDYVDSDIDNTRSELCRYANLYTRLLTRINLCNNAYSYYKYARDLFNNTSPTDDNYERYLQNFNNKKNYFIQKKADVDNFVNDMDGGN